ncbi:YDG domain-containing protein, partial [Methylophilaceae bacterium]|nr:YDG domain-containing protein [Methylophilaceae bacterium]
YDGTDAATVTITLAGLVGAETLTTTETSTFAQSTVGSGITVTVDSISLVDGTGDADNYSISSGQTDTADITAKTLTATADAANKTYDGTTTATVTLTLSGVIAGDSVSSTNGSTFSQSDVGTGITATVNSITLTGDDAGNYNISSGQTDTADITAKALTYTVDASNKTYDGTDAATVSITLAGLVGAETLTATGIATFDSANVGTRTATVNTITLTDGTGDADNYSISSGGTDSASITQKALTYTVDANDKTYDGTNSATATLSLTGLVGSETLGVTNTATFANANAGDDKTVTVTSVNLADGTNGGLAANYSISSGETTTATINKATLNVAPLDDAKFVGEADPAGYNGVIYNGFISGESSSDLGGSTTISRNAGETAGDYTLSLTQALTSDNYTINYGTGTFTIAATTAILVDLVQNNTLYYGSDPTYGSGQSHTISARDIDGALTVTMSGQEATITKSGTTVAVAPLVPNAATSSTAGYYEVGGYNYSVDTADVNYSLADGYSIIVDSGEYNITPLEIDVNATVTVGGLTKTYDGNANISGLTTTISSSPVKTGDDVTFAATGTFDSRHVGTSKTVSISMAISGDDANNYSLSNNSISSNTGTITQLNSVTWLGSAGDGLWATASNWANGAIPDQNNVATVIIPDGSTVNYQYDVLGQIGSAITNNGDLTLSGTTDFTFSNDVAGDGTIIFDADQVGDTLTLSGTSTMSGTVNIQEHTAIIAASNALGTATLRANDGYFSVSSGVTLNQLTTAGQINLTSDLNTNGDIIFGGNLVIAGGNGTDANNLDPLEINSNNNDITFNGTVTAGSSSKANFRSLTIDAGTGEVNINERFGYAFNGVTYSNLTSTNLWQLNVTAAAINLRADVMTFERQTYNGAMFVGDNGTNGLTRTLLSVDPEVIINGTVDDLDPNTSHTLVTKAVSLNTDTPVVNVTGEVGATNPLVNWIAETGRQNTAEEWGNITTGTSGTLTYQGDAISGGAQTLAASEQSGYVAPTNTTTDSTAQNAGSIAGRFKQAYRNIVSNTTEKFREIRQKTMIGIGVKILDENRDCDALGANDCKSTITIRGMLDQLIRKLWIRFA